jgi:polysaccharide pyruvyl transferase WcaK-like protein
MFEYKEHSLQKRVLLVCDNRHQLNWGCRATSLALIHILETSGYDVTSLSEILGQRDSTTRLPRNLMLGRIKNQKIIDIALRATEKLLLKLLGISSVTGYFDVRNLDLVLAAKRLQKISKSNVLAQKILESITESDMIVINGEGDAIFTDPPRFKLLFLLLIMQVAKEYEKPILFINAMISPCPVSGVHRQTMEVFKKITKGISLIAVRDHESLRFAQEIGLSPRRLTFLPDALFAIRSHLMGEYLSLEKTSFTSDFVSHPEPRISRSFDLNPGSYICLSGASRPPKKNTNNWSQWFTELVRQIQTEIDLPLLIVQPCGGESFLSDVAKKCEAMFIPASTSIYWGCRILANSKVYITGRYHPSIMASFGGIPQIMLEANSHKTRSLQELLGKSNPTVYPIASCDDTIESIVNATKDAIESAEINRIWRLEIVKDLGQHASNLGKEIISSLNN